MLCPYGMIKRLSYFKSRSIPSVRMKARRNKGDGPAQEKLETGKGAVQKKKKKNDTALEDMLIRTNQVQDMDGLTSSGPRASLYAHCNKLSSKWHAHRPWQCQGWTLKSKKAGSGLILGIPISSPSFVGISLPLISLWSYPAHKNSRLHTLGPLAFWGGPRCEACFSGLLFWDRPFCLFLSINLLLIYHFASLWNSFGAGTKNLNFNEFWDQVCDFN